MKPASVHMASSVVSLTSSFCSLLVWPHPTIEMFRKTELSSHPISVIASPTKEGEANVKAFTK